jgi:hypothetical protein
VQQRTHALGVRQQFLHVQLCGLLIELHEMQHHLAVTHAETVGDGHAGFVHDVVANFIREIIRTAGDAGRQRQLPLGVHGLHHGRQGCAVTSRECALHVRMQHAKRLAQRIKIHVVRLINAMIHL